MPKKKSRGVAGMAIGNDQKWQVESDLRALMDACEIRKDPKRLNAAAALAKERMVAMGDVAADASESSEK
jgi:hypothetical protein